MRNTQATKEGAKAVELAPQNMVRRLKAQETWAVPSRTSLHVHLVVRFEDGRYYCTCPATVVCWHIEQVETKRAGDSRATFTASPDESPKQARRPG